MAYIQTQGPTVIMTASGKSSDYGVTTLGTSSLAGDWYQIHPRMGRLAFQVNLSNPSASGGTSYATTVYIEVSNDGITPISDKPLTIALVSTGGAGTIVNANGACLGSSYKGQWGYIRANVNSLTTSTAGSTTAARALVSVIVNAGYEG